MAVSIAKRLQVQGTVQGVGFRPHVFQLATALGLTGTVYNTGNGVTIHVEGPRNAVDAFCRQQKEKSPPMARITTLSTQTVPVAGYADFTIGDSREPTEKSTFISPDVGVCDDCLSELYDPQNRRYRYPFINCTQCGPRFTIIEDLPYDRPLTVMRSFAMCDACRSEYEDPANRRFHAQPIACPDCGPGVRLYDSERRPVSGEDPIRDAADLLKRGHVVAVKGLGGFHLAADALNDDAVSRLRIRKHRPDKPLALMSPSLEAARRFAMITEDEAAILQDMARPIVLLDKKTPSPLSGGVAPENRRVGVMLPYTPLHYLLSEAFTALVMTSGNMGGTPVLTETEDAFDTLSGVADYFLVHDRKIFQRCDDSLVHAVAGSLRTVRRARGYVPAPIELNHSMPPVLAVGGEMKNTICITRSRSAFLSQHIGDMANAETFRFFDDTVSHMTHLLGVSPERIACDMHPELETTRYADNAGVEKIAVQHHHAHVAACMAEHRLEGPVIGIALDGTGYGTDGAVWGGEVLVAEKTRFQRFAHLGYVPMPGGDAAVREPWRMAVSYLYHAFGNGLSRLDLPMFGMLSSEAVGMMIKMMERQVNSPPTSSTGRLFDGVAALIGLRRQITFEGQAAMALETAAGADPLREEETYDIVPMLNSKTQVDLRPLIEAVVSDVVSGVSVREISRRFHGAVIALFTDIGAEACRRTGIGTVVLSGGVFQNALVLDGLTRALTARGVDVFSHSRVPTNDGGLSLGQAVVAGSIKQG